MTDCTTTSSHAFWAAPDEERAAFEFLKRYQDRTHSMVDLLSSVMDKLGIGEASAVDSDFTQRFIARPGPIHTAGSHDSPCLMPNR